LLPLSADLADVVCKEATKYAGRFDKALSVVLAITPAILPVKVDFQLNNFEITFSLGKKNELLERKMFLDSFWVE
jgi:hypothetical protein